MENQDVASFFNLHQRAYLVFAQNIHSNDGKVIGFLSVTYTYSMTFPLLKIEVGIKWVTTTCLLL